MFPEEFIDIVDGIRLMRIRGAGLIARKAAEALRIASETFGGEDVSEYMAYLRGAAKALVDTRPTAVSLPNALRYILSKAVKSFEAGAPIDIIKGVVASASEEFIQASLSALDRIGEIGAGRIEDGDTILTHCNSQAAISIIRHAREAGKEVQVFVTESRPRYQGRLTASTLSKLGIPVTMIIDSAARYYMPRIDQVVVGADAITSNGAVVNKIGTASLALAAHEARVRFMVAAETYKFSPETFAGKLVEIEERPIGEVASSKWLSDHPRVKILNPAFDVTPPEYVDAIVTEVGVLSPYSILFIIRERYGWAFQGEPWEP